MHPGPLRVVRDVFDLIGMRRAGAREAKAALWRAIPSLILIGIVSWVSLKAGAVVAVGLLSAHALHEWARFERRPTWQKALALLLVCAAAAPVVAVATGLLPWLVRASRHTAREHAQVGFLVACAPSLLTLGSLWLTENAHKADPRRAAARGAVLGAVVGLAVGALLFSPHHRGVPAVLMTLIPTLLLAFKGCVWGLRLAELQQLSVEAQDELLRERLERDPISRAGLTRADVERVYRTLSRFVYLDGRVDADERAALEALRTRFELEPEEANALEREGRLQTRFRISRNHAEQALLVNAVGELCEAKAQVSERERRFMRRLLAAVDLPERVEDMRIRDPLALLRG